MIHINGQDKDRYDTAGRVCAIRTAASKYSTEGGTPPPGDEPDSVLEEVARREREYVRRRLREDLNREPTEEEMDDWLRQQTEGH